MNGKKNMRGREISKAAKSGGKPAFRTAILLWDPAPICRLNEIERSQEGGLSPRGRLHQLTATDLLIAVHLIQIALRRIGLKELAFFFVVGHGFEGRVHIL